MKKVIDGKVYNTETAEEVAKWNNGYYCTDFHYCKETLYQTHKGAFFVYGKGGPLSSYGEPCGNNGYGGGSDIRALTHEEALAWVEERDIDPEDVEEYFSFEEA